MKPNHYLQTLCYEPAVFWDLAAVLNFYSSTKLLSEICPLYYKFCDSAQLRFTTHLLASGHYFTSDNYLQFCADIQLSRPWLYLQYFSSVKVEY
jgi:hypothetical protein